MSVAAPPEAPSGSGEDARLESLGYEPQLNRVLGFFENFSVAFTYLSPMVGIYTLFLLGVGTGGPAYVWLTFIPVIGMLFVALVFGELASHYPVAGALYQYSKFSVGPALRLVRRLVLRPRPPDHGRCRRHRRRHLRRGADPQLVRLEPRPRAKHETILIITLILLAIQTTLNITGAKVMGARGAVRRLRRDRRHARDRADPPHPRLPSRPRLPLHRPGRGGQGDATRSGLTSTGAGSRPRR